MIDSDFMTKVKEVKVIHERYLTAILTTEEFPELERDPFEHREEDEVPKKFESSKWYMEEERKDEDEGRKTLLTDNDEQLIEDYSKNTTRIL